jgi:hypothetical protein
LPRLRSPVRTRSSARRGSEQASFLIGGVAERRGNGLQSRVRGFESRLHLETLEAWAIGAAVARFPDTEEVTGSNPVSPTQSMRLLPRSGARSLCHFPPGTAGYPGTAVTEGACQAGTAVTGEAIFTREAVSGRHPGTPRTKWPENALLFPSRVEETRRSADVAQLVERNLAKVEVAGSRPVVRSDEVSRLELCGGVAERRGNGLQSRLHGFESRLHLETRSGPGAIGAAVARFPDTEEVTGSNPVSPTNRRLPGQRQPARESFVSTAAPRWSARLWDAPARPTPLPTTLVHALELGPHGGRVLGSGRPGSRMSCRRRRLPSSPNA